MPVQNQGMERDRGGRPRHPDILTPAEWRVIEELRTGGTNAEIAVRLDVSPDAVKYHISNMLGKLDLDDRHQLAAWRPEDRRPRRLGFLALPAAFTSLGRPLLWAGGGLLAVAAVAAVAVIVIAAFGNGDEPPASLASGEVAGGGAVVDQADVRYVNELCLAFTSLTEEGREAAGGWDVHFETWGDDIGNIPDDQLGEFSAEVLVGTWKRHGTDLKRIAAPPGVEEFHASAVSYRVGRIEALDPLLGLFPSEGGSDGPSARQAYARLIAGIGEITVNVPSASVELRSRLWAAVREAPDCTNTDFLTDFLVVFLGGGEPTLEPSPADQRYLAAVCTAGHLFMASIVETLSELNNRLTDERRAEVFSELVDAMSDLQSALRTASPPGDLASHHLEYLEVLDEAVAFYGNSLQHLERGNGTYDPPMSREQFARLQRAFGLEGDPTAPPKVRARLLEAANSIEECGGTGFLQHPPRGLMRSSGWTETSPVHRPPAPTPRA